MNFLILHYGESWQAVASTSLIRGLKKRYADCQIAWATCPENISLYQYNERLSDVYVGFGPFKGNFDVAINLSPSLAAIEAIEKTKASSKLGFVMNAGKIVVSDPKNEDILEVLLGKRKTTKHILQMYYRLAGLRWKGEGYDLAYYPRNKMKKRKTGIAVADNELRSFVKDNLQLDYSELWHVPLRTNLLKRIDELNRVKHLITDDLFCAHVGIATRKHVEFLDKKGLNMSLEFFSKGHHHRIDNEPNQLQSD
jgi:hypothetical protein